MGCIDITVYKLASCSMHMPKHCCMMQYAAEGGATDSGPHVPLQGRQDQGRHPAAGLQGSGAPHARPVAFYRGAHTALQIEYSGCNKLKKLSNIPVMQCEAAAKAYNACDWGLLQAAANFTPLQRQQLIALRAKFLRDIDEVVAERRMLTQGIKVTAFALIGILLG